MVILCPRVVLLTKHYSCLGCLIQTRLMHRPVACVADYSVFHWNCVLNLQSSQGNDFDPTDGKYIRESVYLVVPCVVLACVVAVSFQLFFLIRCCCFCAGNVSLYTFRTRCRCRDWVVCARAPVGRFPVLEEDVDCRDSVQRIKHQLLGAQSLDIVYLGLHFYLQYSWVVQSLQRQERLSVPPSEGWQTRW